MPTEPNQPVPNNQFKPYEAEKPLTVQITAREASILNRIRKSPSHAKILIIKQNNLIVRVTEEISLLVTVDGVKEASQ